MKRIAFVISLLTLSCTIAQAQQEYFLFVWADNQQPFYVRLNEKTYSSSTIGHLVVPRLKDSTYSLTVGFPKNQFPEQDFVITLNNKDLDLQLKPTGGGGWRLFNEQTSETLKPREEYSASQASLGLGERKTGGFATLMSGLVNDSTVMYKSLTKTELPVKQPVVSEEKSLAVATQLAQSAQPDTPVSAPPPATDSVIPAATLAAANPIDTVKAAAPASDSLLAQATPAPPSTIIQVQEWWNDKGKGFIYYDSSATGTDTISLMIDYDKNAGLATPEEVIAAPAKVDSVKTAALKPDTVLAQKQEPQQKTDSTKKATASPVTAAVQKPEKKTDTTKNSLAAPPTAVVQKETQKPKTEEKPASPVATVTHPDTAAKITALSGGQPASPAKDSAVAQTSTTTTTAESKKTLLLMNSDCNDFASEYDVDKLRVKMLKEDNTDGKIAAAKKIFKTKCFVTRYIRGLSELFPNDEDRFKFFDAAYPFVSDSGNFRSLLDLFTDDLYIARFKALVRM